MFKNDCFIELEVDKHCLSFLLAEISEQMYASYVFPDKNQNPLCMSRMQITKQAVIILSLISSDGIFQINHQNFTRIHYCSMGAFRENLDEFYLRFLRDILCFVSLISNA